MAEWYARDTSKKIKSVMIAKAKNGKRITNSPIYGYAPDPNDKDKWVIDPVAAPIVKRIFKMAMDGMGVHQIARVLAEEKIERPSYYLGKQGRGRHKNDYNIDRAYGWSSPTVAIILRKPEYVGHIVNMRTATVDFKSKKKKKIPMEDWLIFPNSHEAIVDQKTFDIVQKLRETPRRTDTIGEANPLTGMLWCADCGAKLYNQRRSTVDKDTHKKLRDAYHCSNYKLSGKRFSDHCTAHHFNTYAAREIILGVIRNTCGFIREHETKFIEMLRESSVIKQEETAKAYKKQINKNQRRLAEIDQIYKRLYEDQALGKITEDVFNQMTEGYQQERIDLCEKAEALQSELDAFNDENTRADKFVELVHRHTSFETLTSALLYEFVDKVVVHESKWSEGNTGVGGRPRGIRTQQVDVYLKYIGNFNPPDMRTAEEIEAENARAIKLEARRKRSREDTRRRAEQKRKKEAASEIAL